MNTLEIFYNVDLEDENKKILTSYSFNTLEHAKIFLSNASPKLRFEYEGDIKKIIIYEIRTYKKMVWEESNDSDNTNADKIIEQD